MVPHITHDIFRHADKAITGIDAPVRSDSKRISHAIHERADVPLAGEHAPAEIVDVHHIDLLHVFERFVEEEDKQVPILFRLESPLCGIFRSQGG